VIHILVRRALERNLRPSSIYTADRTPPRRMWRALGQRPEIGGGGPAGRTHNARCEAPTGKPCFERGSGTKAGGRRTVGHAVMGHGAGGSALALEVDGHRPQGPHARPDARRVVVATYENSMSAASMSGVGACLRNEIRSMASDSTDAPKRHSARRALRQRSLAHQRTKRHGRSPRRFRYRSARSSLRGRRRRGSPGRGRASCRYRDRQRTVTPGGERYDPPTATARRFGESVP